MNLLPARATAWQMLFWCAFWVAVPVLLSGDWTGSSFRPPQLLSMVPGIALVVLVNLEWLLPGFYFKHRRIGLYVAAGLGLVVVVTVLAQQSAEWIATHLYNVQPPRTEVRARAGSGRLGLRYLSLGTPFFTAFIGSALVAVATFANRKDKEAALLRSEKLEAEMQFLKSQINPHFLFNALNNIYTLTVLKSEQAPTTLLKLSAMLRYVLYDCKAATVPLHKEIEYLRHFIDLYLLKDSRGLNVRVQLDESRPNLLIAPMLLIPFVENAFKHSRIEDLDRGWIEINLQTGESGIEFAVRNSRPEGPSAKDAVGGIGLQNVRRQLELLYPDRHTLEIREEARSFSILLKIRI